MAEQVRLSRSLYLPEAIQAAAEAFSGLATIEVTVRDADIEVSIAEPDPDVADVLTDELLNHALAETVVRSRSRT